MPNSHLWWSSYLYEYINKCTNCLYANNMCSRKKLLPGQRNRVSTVSLLELSLPHQRILFTYASESCDEKSYNPPAFTCFLPFLLSLPPYHCFHNLLDSRLALLPISWLTLTAPRLSISLARFLTATNSRCCFVCSNVFLPRFRCENRYVNQLLISFSSARRQNDRKRLQATVKLTECLVNRKRSLNCCCYRR